MSILHKSYKKIYPIIKKFESFCVTELKDQKNLGIIKKPSKETDSRLKHKRREQEKLMLERIEEVTKDEKFNLENLLGFINQRKLHSYLNISNIMRLSKLDFPDLYFVQDLDMMLVRKTLLEKVSSINYNIHS